MKLKINRKITTKIPLTTLKTFFFRIGVGDKSVSLFPFLGLNLGSVTPMKTFFRVEVVFLLYLYVLFAFQCHQSSKSNRSEGILEFLPIFEFELGTSRHQRRPYLGGKSGILAVICP